MRIIDLFASILPIWIRFKAIFCLKKMGKSTIYLFATDIYKQKNSYDRNANFFSKNTNSNKNTFSFGAKVVIGFKILRERKKTHLSNKNSWKTLKDDKVRKKYSNWDNRYQILANLEKLTFLKRILSTNRKLAKCNWSNQISSRNVILKCCRVLIFIWILYESHNEMEIWPKSGHRTESIINYQ